MKCIDKETLRIVAIKMLTWWTTYTENEVGNFVDFDVHSCKRCCIVKVQSNLLYLNDHKM